MKDVEREEVRIFLDNTPPIDTGEYRENVIISYKDHGVYRLNLVDRDYQVECSKEDLSEICGMIGLKIYT